MTHTSHQIIPVVREAVAQESEDTKDKVEAVLTRVEQVNEKVATAETPLEAAEKGWKATEPFNPVYGYGAAVIAILKALQLGKQKKETENILIHRVPQRGIAETKKIQGTTNYTNCTN